ncbi:hypothetical protein V6N11_026510 [Hibiscus sabdariffa]|uniref:Cysteine proteinase inhibitor n=1 Tax=Hibiscus sabdariffa TaxID=183260 RepID=A0ABR2SWT1_9ROSI
MAKVGGISQVEGSANSLEFENLARFAVDEHNKKGNAMLQFKKVTNVKQQVVSGAMISSLLAMPPPPLEVTGDCTGGRISGYRMLVLPLNKCNNVLSSFGFKLY